MLNNTLKQYIIDLFTIISLFHGYIIIFTIFFFFYYKKRKTYSFWNEFIDYFYGLFSGTPKPNRLERVKIKLKRLKVRRRWFRRLNLLVLISLCIILLFPYMGETKYGILYFYEFHKWW